MSVTATTPRPGSTDHERPVADLTYEEARDELVRVVGRLEAGGATLEESLALWERGEALAERCQEWLDGARQRLEEARGADQPTGPEGDDDGARTVAGATTGGGDS